MAESAEDGQRTAWPWRRWLHLVPFAERVGIGTLMLLLLLAGGIWAFVELADEVVEGETAAIDRALLLALRRSDDLSDPLGPHWLEELGRDFTALGGVGVLTLLTLMVAGYLALHRLRGAMLLVLASVGGGLLVSTVMKEIFERPRPDLVPHGSYVYTASFPSGHSMMAAATYLTLAALLARVQPNHRLRAYLLGLAVLVTVLVGVSRVYLGVHWPTDVLAGWTVGAAWALVVWLTARWLQARGHVETEAQMERDDHGPQA
ncbi:MAG TPA: phosphatase PAP2 family protein [Azospirillum sp.]|nr:phosphatase PAP2 family protein [Azospirillum sp.]